MNEGLRVGVLGAGAWGLALAVAAARGGMKVTLWSRQAEVAEGIRLRHRHPRIFSDFDLPSSVSGTTHREAIAGSDFLIIATPAQALRDALTHFAPLLRNDIAAVIAAKGIEIGTGKFMTDVFHEICPRGVPYVLSGPSFAADVLAGKPTALTLAGREPVATRELAAQLSLQAFRIYTTSDLAGVQLGGAVKNVLAIACGITEGKGLGASARAALTARAFSELMRLGRELGAVPETLTGLSGLGDLVLTCSSLQSRNFSFGVELGRGGEVRELASGAGKTIEGIPTARAVDIMARERRLDVPICKAVHAIISGANTVDQAIAGLLARPLRSEHDSSFDQANN